MAVLELRVPAHTLDADGSADEKERDGEEQGEERRRRPLHGGLQRRNADDCNMLVDLLVDYEKRCIQSDRYSRLFFWQQGALTITHFMRTLLKQVLGGALQNETVTHSSLQPVQARNQLLVSLAQKPIVVKDLL